MNQSMDLCFASVVEQAIESELPASICTVLAPDGTFGPSGAPSQNYVPVSGLQGIVVMNSPRSGSERISASKEKTVETQTSFTPRHIWLAGYFPQIQTHWLAQITDSSGFMQSYDILAVEPDSHSQTTHVEGRFVSI